MSTAMSLHWADYEHAIKAEAHLCWQQHRNFVAGA